MIDDDSYKHKNDRENNKIQQSQDLTKEINKLKEKLNDKIVGKDSIYEEILKLSCELDVLIMEFMKNKKL